MGLHCLLACLFPSHGLSHVLRLSPPWSFSNHNRILVYSPQIIENYQLKSGEGLSVLFVLIWLAGDVFNLVGAGMAGLIPTVIILGVYVCHLTSNLDYTNELE